MTNHAGSTAKISRRSFLSSLIGVMGGAMGLLVGVPVIGSLISPALKKAEESSWVNLGPVASFPPNKPRLVPITLIRKDGWVTEPVLKSVWVVTREDGGTTVFNPRCTHLGCAVDWREGSDGEAFYSPCHGGIFSIEGALLKGPPPRSLDTLEYEVRDGDLYCRYQDFRVGIPEKVPA